MIDLKLSFYQTGMGGMEMKMEMEAKASRRGFAAGAKYAMHAPYRDLKRGTVED